MTIPTAAAPEHELWLALQLSGTSNTVTMPALSAKADRKDLGQLVASLCGRTTAGQQETRRNPAPPSSVSEAAEFLQPLEGLLSNWPNGYRAHVSGRLRERPAEARTLSGALGVWYQRVKRCCATGPLYPFLGTVIEVASQEFPGVIGLDAGGAGPDSTEYVTLKQGATRLGVSHDRLSDAIDRGAIAGSVRQFGHRRLAHYLKRQDVEEVRRERSQWIGEDEACTRLDVPPAVFALLVSSGLLVADKQWRRDLLKGGPVSRVSIESLERSLFAVSKSEAGDGDLIELRHLSSRRMGERGAIEAALRAIAACQVQPMSKPTGGQVGRLAYRLADIRQFFGMPVLEAGLSLQQLSTLTGWKYESVCHWVAEGLLQVETIKVRGQTCRVVTPEQLLRFSREFIPLTDVAAMLRSKPSAVARRLHGLDLVGAKPQPNGARRGGLLRLADVISQAWPAAGSAHVT